MSIDLGSLTPRETVVVNTRASVYELIVLRGDAGAWDIGYTRTAQRADGKLMTAYYWATEPMKERTIEATIWDPGAKPK